MQNLKTKSSTFFLMAFPLLLVLFIDGMGLGLIIPALNALLDPHAQFLSSNLSMRYHNFIFGSVIGVFMLCWFFGAAVLGDLSDQFGRKKSLLICLIGGFLGYLFSAFAVVAGSFTLLLVGRIIAGITSGSQPIAQAAIIDISKPEHQVRNIGFILMAISLGFILGPLLGGLLSNNHILSWFNLATPFYFAAGLSLLNALLLNIFFKESFQGKGTFNIKIERAWKIFASAFQHPSISRLSVIFLFFILAWSSFYSFIAVFLIQNYGFTSTTVSLFMAAMGIGLGIGNGWMVNIFAKKFTPQFTIISSTLVSAILIFIMIYTSYAIYCWILIAPLACAAALVYANMLGLFSSSVNSEEQGWVMGVTGSIMALVWGLVAILVGALATYNVRFPLLLAIAGFIGTALLMKTTLSRRVPQAEQNNSEVITT